MIQIHDYWIDLFYVFELFFMSLDVMFTITTLHLNQIKLLKRNAHTINCWNLAKFCILIKFNVEYKQHLRLCLIVCFFLQKNASCVRLLHHWSFIFARWQDAKYKIFEKKWFMLRWSFICLQYNAQKDLFQPQILLT